jgi:hypothetical protein
MGSRTFGMQQVVSFRLASSPAEQIMRIISSQIESIRRAAQSVLGPQVPIGPFGSRVNDDLKGGDTDLLFKPTTRHPTGRKPIAASRAHLYERWEIARLISC